MDTQKSIKTYIRSTGTNRYGRIRQHARQQTSSRQQKCEECGYKKHVETCHIKPICEFSDDDLLSDVNAPSNLKLLCPNCHWEYDDKIRQSSIIKLTTCKCGNTKYRYSDKCRSCQASIRRSMTPRKVTNRPTKEELISLVAVMPITAIGKKYGVSDNCIRKWIKSYL